MNAHINKNIYEQKTYFAVALDPIHIGTGGYRLGRVDNTIVREPGTNLPKIPGTSIEGCARTYSYYKEKEKNSIREACAVGKKIKNKNQEDQEPCGSCKICIVYGYTSDKKSLHGMAQFSDARILFFPVYSMCGPVWITCPSVLKEFGIDKNVSDDKKIKTSIIEKNKNLNLGWLYLENEENVCPVQGELNEIYKEVKERSVLVSDKFFSHIVNSNLEVRTSVAIDPTTGAAEKHALYTYEAIPRATILWFNVVANNPKNFDISQSDKVETIQDVISVVEDGMRLFEFLGIGGMVTRGFGRLKILNFNQ